MYRSRWLDKDGKLLGIATHDPTDVDPGMDMVQVRNALLRQVPPRLVRESVTSIGFEEAVDSLWAQKHNEHMENISRQRGRRVAPA